MTYNKYKEVYTQGYSCSTETNKTHKKVHGVINCFQLDELELLFGPFYGGPYHLISLLENDQYERIRWLRLIVYHHNLHMWYRVVCIGGMDGIIGSLISVA
jgi:hypothetical protein